MYMKQAKGYKCQILFAQILQAGYVKLPVCTNLAAGEASVENDPEGVDAGRDEEDGLPLRLDGVHVLVVLCDLLRRDRADHT